VLDLLGPDAVSAQHLHLDFGDLVLVVILLAPCCHSQYDAQGRQREPLCAREIRAERLGQTAACAFPRREPLQRLGHSRRAVSLKLYLALVTSDPTTPSRCCCRTRRSRRTPASAHPPGDRRAVEPRLDLDRRAVDGAARPSEAHQCLYSARDFWGRPQHTSARAAVAEPTGIPSNYLTSHVGHTDRSVTIARRILSINIPRGIA
jgi:hypothetical protein